MKKEIERNRRKGRRKSKDDKMEIEGKDEGSRRKVRRKKEDNTKATEG